MMFYFFAGCLMMCVGIYALAFSIFWPHKLGLSPKLPLWAFRTGCIVGIICGFLQAFLPIILH